MDRSRRQVGKAVRWLCILAFLFVRIHEDRGISARAASVMIFMNMII